MSDLLNKCEEYFSTRDFYEVLNINSDATPSEVKKAYHKLSLLVHPDRVEDSKKEVATEKFKVLGKVYSILQDADRRKIYDDNGEFDEESDNGINWMEYWRRMFKKISTEDIENHKRSYIGSDTEIRDIKKAYIHSKGDMNKILERVPYCNCDSEPRIMEIVKRLVDAGEVEHYDIFFKEPKRRKENRRRKWEAEAREVENMNVTDEQLAMEIQKNHEEREKQFMSFMSDLESKYCSKNSNRKSITGNKRKAKESTVPQQKKKKKSNDEENAPKKEVKKRTRKAK